MDKGGLQIYRVKAILIHQLCDSFLSTSDLLSICDRLHFHGNVSRSWPPAKYVRQRHAAVHKHLRERGSSPTSVIVVCDTAFPHGSLQQDNEMFLKIDIMIMMALAFVLVA